MTVAVVYVLVGLFGVEIGSPFGVFVVVVGTTLLLLYARGGRRSVFKKNESILFLLSISRCYTLLAPVVFIYCLDQVILIELRRHRTEQELALTMHDLSHCHPIPCSGCARGRQNSHLNHLQTRVHVIVLVLLLIV